MKQIILLVIIIVTLSSFTPFSLGIKKEDRKEYLEYLDYCNEFVPHKVIQWRKFRVKNINGYWIDSTGYYERDSAYKVFYYKMRIPKYEYPIRKEDITIVSYEAYEQAEGFVHVIYIRRRKHSVRDFYEFWNPNN